MRLLLDTQACLWFLAGDGRLSAHARAAVESAGARWLSLVSVWEIAIKTSLGKLELAIPLADLVETQLPASGISLLPITASHILKVQQLPLHHRDPFDRLLIALTQSESLDLVSSDGILDSYGITRIW